MFCDYVRLFLVQKREADDHDQFRDAHRVDAAMKLPDLYTDWRVMAGMALMVLGAANWVVGLNRTHEYSRIIAKAPEIAADQAYRSFDELDPHSDGAVLAPFTNQQRRVSYATARMDFYHAAFLTGQALVMTGVALTLLGFIIAIRRDHRRAHHRLRARRGGDGPLMV